MPRSPADRHWLNRERLRLYPPVFVAAYLVAAVLWLGRSSHRIDALGHPLIADFIDTWAASWLALHGQAASAYDPAQLTRGLQAAVPGVHLRYAWLYPPAYFLLISPLALLPSSWAYLSFMLSTLSAVLAALRKLLDNRTAWWCAAAFPGLWFNAYNGQNGFLTAALAAAALFTLPRRPLLAGVWVGLLAMKPQLALGFAPALLAIGAWPTLAVAAATAVAANALGVAVLGGDVLHASLANLGLARELLEHAGLPWVKMPSVYAALRLLGVASTPAWIAQSLGTLTAVVLLWRVWRRCANWELRGAALMTATLLISPYVFDYDLVWLAFPLAWIARIGLRQGWQRGEREILLAAWLLPLLVPVLAVTTHVQPGPVVLGALLWQIGRHAGALGPAQATARSAG